jgi:hypothetical protein
MTCPRSAGRSSAGSAAFRKEGQPNAHVFYDSGGKQNFTAYKLLIADVENGRLVAVPRGVMAAGAVMEGSRGVDVPKGDIDRIKSHLAKYYRKMDDTPPWEAD